MNLFKEIFKSPLLIVLVTIMALATCAQTKKSPMMPYDYEKAWKEVTDYENKGLPESALKTVNTIYEQAKKDNNAAQLVKAVIHQLKFTDYKEENAFIKNLDKLRTEAQTASFPVKPILHSMLGEMYWQYYQNNRYRFNNRTDAPAVKQDDIETWSLEKIVDETLTQYKLSLLESEKSKATSIELYIPILNQGNTIGRKFRPTLYDFLAHRAIGFSGNDEASITRPSYSFELDKPAYFSAASDFARLRFETKDSTSLKLFALTTLRDLIQFHLEDKDPEALIDVDIERLLFVNGNYVAPSKDVLYVKAVEELEKRFITSPASTRVTFLRAQFYAGQANLYKPLQSDEHKWDYRRANEICDSARQRFKDSYGVIQCENLQEEIRTKSIQSTIEEVNVPNQVFRSLVQYRNFTDLYYRIIKVTRREVREQRTKWNKDYNVDREQKFIEYFAAKTPVKSGSYSLPDDKDFQHHRIEVKLDALPEGEYMVLFSHQKDFKTSGNGLAYAFTTVSNISYLHRAANDGGTEFYVLNRESGAPLYNIKADVYSNRYNYQRNNYEAIKVTTVTSDAKGFFKVAYIMDDKRRNFFVELRSGQDFISTESIDNQNYYGGSIGQYKQEKPEKHQQTFFFLDRAIYRPGQTIYFKGLVVTNDGQSSTIKTSYKTTLTLLDVNYQSRGQVEVTTNEYGTFSGTFTAPSSGLTGEMQIQNNDNSGTVSFSVEEYKRPKFEVTFSPVKGSFKLGERVTANGQATAYSGANIDGAKVAYRVVRVANFPFWWWCRWGYYPTSPEMEITSGETQTNAEGKFDVSFEAIPDLSVSPDSDPTFTYTIYADVTDINGETHSNTTSVEAGYKYLKVGVPMENINKDLFTPSKEFDINTTNLAGEFEPAKGSIKIYRLKSPVKAFRQRLWEQPDRSLYTRDQYYAAFPYDLYEDELNKFKWERLSQVLNANFDTGTKKTFSIPDLGSWSQGEYVLEIVANDKAGKEVKEVSYFTVYSPKDKNVPTPSVNYFQELKLTAEPGEKASFVAGTSEKKVPVLYEVERDGQILTKEWITLNDEQRVFEIPVREEHRGNLGIHYTFIRNNRLYAVNQVVVVPFTNKSLDISFESFRDKLLPGTRRAMEDPRERKERG
jgi:hypothetical protein